MATHLTGLGEALERARTVRAPTTRLALVAAGSARVFHALESVETSTFAARLGLTATARSEARAAVALELTLARHAVAARLPFAAALDRDSAGLFDALEAGGAGVVAARLFERAALVAGLFAAFFRASQPGLARFAAARFSRRATRARPAVDVGRAVRCAFAREEERQRFVIAR